jgi:protein-disulfide isomerase
VVEPELARRYIDTGKVRLIWRDFTWIGDESRLAAQAARCAGRQGKFWEYHDYLFHNQRGENRGQFSGPNLRQFATIVGLEATAFDSCLDRAEDLPQIQQELTEARSRGVIATPAFLLNGQWLIGAQGVDAFAQAIDAELARVGQ